MHTQTHCRTSSFNNCIFPEQRYASYLAHGPAVTSTMGSGCGRDLPPRLASATAVRLASATAVSLASAIASAVLRHCLLFQVIALELSRTVLPPCCRRLACPRLRSRLATGNASSAIRICFFSHSCFSSSDMSGGGDGALAAIDLHFCR